MEQVSDRFTLRIARLAVLSALPAIAAASSLSSTLAHLPNVQIRAAKVDASGNIYLAGQTTTNAGSGAAYIARLSPNGTTVYAVTIGGSGDSAFGSLPRGAERETLLATAGIRLAFTCPQEPLCTLCELPRWLPLPALPTGEGALVHPEPERRLRLR
jgi:hypothetical protein